jgi:hypothetical protein
MAAGKPIGADLDRLEQRLVLHSWINGLLGYGSTGELLSDFKDADEGFDGEGRSYVLRSVMTRESWQKVSPADLPSRRGSGNRQARETFAGVNKLREVVQFVMT